MPLQVKITISGDKKEIAKFRKLGKSLLNMPDTMKLIGQDLKGYYAGQVFASQGGALGKKWAPLNAYYAKRKAKKYRGRGILIASGKMQKSFKFKATGSSVEVYNTSPHFVYHQSARARTVMPYRPMMGINNAVKSTIKERVQEGVNKKIIEAGL